MGLRHKRYSLKRILTSIQVIIIKISCKLSVYNNCRNTRRIWIEVEDMTNVTTASITIRQTTTDISTVTVHQDQPTNIYSWFIEIVLITVDVWLIVIEIEVTFGIYSLVYCQIAKPLFEFILYILWVLFSWFILLSLMFLRGTFIFFLFLLLDWFYILDFWLIWCLT